MTAAISECGLYRFDLHREIPNGQRGRRVAFVMCNPSTADAALDDPTVRRCRSFAHRDNAELLTVVNLWSYRATDPNELLAAELMGIDITGDDAGGLRALTDALSTCQRVVVAWGAVAARVPGFPERVEFVVDIATRQMGHELWSLGQTKDGHPRHPLYVRGDRQFQRWAA